MEWKSISKNYTINLDYLITDKHFTANVTHNMQQILSMIPIIIFFIAYKFGNLIIPDVKPIIIATFCLVLSSIFSLCYHFVLKKKQDKMAFYSNIAIIIFGSMTVLLQNPSFIKIKITFINAIFGCIMLYNFSKENPPIQKMFAGKIDMSNMAWRKFSLRMAILFFIIAIANEIVYHNFAEESWVNFKVFYVPIFFFIYCIMQVFFIMKSDKSKQ